MNINELHPYCGKISVPGSGKQISQDRTRTLTNQIKIVKKAQRGELFALFDGMGSKGQSGSDAAEIMCDVVVDFFKKFNQIPGTAENLKELLVVGNMSIYGWGIDPNTKKTKGGCVGTIFWIFKEEIYLFHVGDSAAFCVSRNKATRLTSKHCDKNGFIYSFFGIGPKLKIDTRKIQIEECDYLVILSDGIADYCSEEDIFQVVKHQELHKAPNELVRIAQSKNSHDDLTAIIVDIGEID